MQIVGLTGLPRSGKDTVGLHMMTNFGYNRMAFAEPLKNAASILLNRPFSEMNGINYDREQVMPEWGFSVRHFLRWLGTEGLRNFDPDFWVKHLAVVAADQGYEKIVITDVRFPNEANWIREQGGILIDVRRPGAVGSAHVSDQGLPLVEHVIENDGTRDDLMLKVDALGAKLGWGPAPFLDHHV